MNPINERGGGATIAKSIVAVRCWSGWFHRRSVEVLTGKEMDFHELR